MVENEENQRRLRDEAEREKNEVTIPLFRTSGLRKSMHDSRTNLREKEMKKREKEKRRLKL